jgi:D-alanyl-D-alanine carboxypeptidase
MISESYKLVKIGTGKFHSTFLYGDMIGLGNLKSMRFLITIIIGLTIISCAGASAQSLKDSTARRLGMELLSSINSGDHASQLHFINANLDKEAIQKTSAADRVKELSYLYDKTGGFDFVPPLSPAPVPPGIEVLLIHSKKGNFWINLRLVQSQEEKNKLSGYYFIHQEDPNPGNTEPWPREKLPEDGIVQEIEKHINLAVGAGKFSGVVLIAKADKVLIEKVYGFADQGLKIPNNSETKFNLGSMCKMFTSVAIAQLVQAGKLSYTDTLASVLPDFPNKETAAKITIQQLLTHTSGLGDFFKPEFFEHRDKYKSLGSYLPLFADDPLLFAPGSGGSYSNAGFIVLGLVIEKLSGENYFDYLKKHIFQPAGMTSSDFYDRDATVPNMALGYTYDDMTDPLHINGRLLNTPFLPEKGSAAGGGYSTANDLLRFSQALFGNRLISAALTDSITTAKVSSPRGPQFHYGYGFNIITGFSGRHIIGHGGGSRGINGALWMIPANGYSIVVLANYDPPAADGMAKEIADFLITQ